MKAEQVNNRKSKVPNVLTMVRLQLLIVNNTIKNIFGIL